MMSSTIASISHIPAAVQASRSRGDSTAATGSSQAPPGQQPADPASLPADRKTLDQALGSIRETLQSIHRNLEFSVDESSGLTVVKVIDSSTGDVIRQIPSEITVKLAESLKEANSLLFTEQA